MYLPLKEIQQGSTPWQPTIFSPLLTVYNRKNSQQSTDPAWQSVRNHFANQSIDQREIVTLNREDHWFEPSWTYQNISVCIPSGYELVERLTGYMHVRIVSDGPKCSLQFNWIEHIPPKNEISVRFRVERPQYVQYNGELFERLMDTSWKDDGQETGAWVRIPHSPPE